MNTELYREAFNSTNEVIRLGLLHVPSGALVASDPFFCANAMSFAQNVIPGDYEVQLHIIRSDEWGQRVALARVLFLANAEVSSLVPAAIEQTGANLYCVDSGLGSFMDESARGQFAIELSDFYRTSPRGNYYTDVLKMELEQSIRTSQGITEVGQWTLHTLPRSSHNVAIFASGLGDGCFESFWAISPDGNVTALVTDFGLL
jgi:hypothetical protein